MANNRVDYNSCLLNPRGSPIVERSTRDPFAICDFMWPEHPNWILLHFPHFSGSSGYYADYISYYTNNPYGRKRLTSDVDIFYEFYCLWETIKLRNHKITKSCFRVFSPAVPEYRNTCRKVTGLRNCNLLVQIGVDNTLNKYFSLV